MAEFKPKVWMTCPLCGKQSPMPDPDHRKWHGLTDGEIEVCHEEIRTKLMNTYNTKDIYRVLEAKLKEKNRV